MIFQKMFQNFLFIYFEKSSENKFWKLSKFFKNYYAELILNLFIFTLEGQPL